MTAISLVEVPWSHPDGAALRLAQEEELHDRYGGPDPHPPEGPDVAVFLVAYAADGEPLGCGGLRPLTGELDGMVEIKRMYVAPAFRRRGLSRQILAGLEAAAARLGWGVVRLETGEMQPEAIALYTSSGYAQIERYGAYVDEEWSLCFEKVLKPR